MACQNGHVEVVRLLLDAGADKNQTDKVNVRYVTSICDAMFVINRMHCFENYDHDGLFIRMVPLLFGRLVIMIILKS